MTTKLLTVALLSCGTLAFVCGCEEKPTDAPKPTPNTSVDVAPTTPPTTGPSAADSTNTPTLDTGGLAPAAQPVRPATTSGAAVNKESRIGNSIDVGGTGASVPIDIDAGIAPPTREEKTGRP